MHNQVLLCRAQVSPFSRQLGRNNKGESAAVLDLALSGAHSTAGCPRHGCCLRTRSAADCVLRMWQRTGVAPLTSEMSYSLDVCASADGQGHGTAVYSAASSQLYVYFKTNSKRAFPSTHNNFN